MTNIRNRAERTTLLVIAAIAAIILIMMIAPEKAAAMTKDQAAAEKEIINDLKNHDESIDVSKYDLTAEELVEVQHDIYYQHPEAFFLDTFRYTTRNGKAVSCKPSYTMSKAAAVRGQKKMVKVAKQCRVNGSKAKKVKKIHNWIIKRTSYNSKASNTQRYNAYGALVNKKAVCMGYAMAFKMIANDNGIECQIVMNKKGTHAWNVVKIGNKWYNVDATHDDMGKKASVKKLLVADKKVGSHTGPKCTKNYRWK